MKQNKSKTIKFKPSKCKPKKGDIIVQRNMGPNKTGVNKINAFGIIIKIHKDEYIECFWSDILCLANCVLHEDREEFTLVSLK